ncbi:50S ribosomal protein L15 [bacterium]|nr:50S ribosomal protein L15 [bacterium]
MTLSELRNNPGARKGTRRKGRGPGSGRGKTCGKGHKGQKARVGKQGTRGFEGGQMPLYRRLPKKGFNHTRFKTVYCVVNLKALNAFDGGSRITPSVLKKKRLIASVRLPVKVLGDGELTVKLDVVAHAFSQKAREAIERQGGTCEIIG